MQTQGQKSKKKKQKVKAGKLMKSKAIAKAVRNTRKKGKKQLNPDLGELLKPSDEDVLKLLAAQTHIGRKSAHVNMKRYIWKRRQDGIHIFNLEKTWGKLVLAARIIVTVKDFSEVMVMSSRTYGQRGAIKFAKHTGATAHASKWVPGTLTNPQNKAYKEPRLLIVDDPMTNFAALRETSYIGIPVIAFCNSDNNTRFVDCAIPCNNKGRYSIGLMFWFLAREILRMRGTLSRSSDWFKTHKDACPDLFFYRDPNEIAKAKKEREERERLQQEQNDGGYGSYDPNIGISNNTNNVQINNNNINNTGINNDINNDNNNNNNTLDDNNNGIQAMTGITNMVNDTIGTSYDDIGNTWQNEAPNEQLDDWGNNNNNNNNNNDNQLQSGYDDMAMYDNQQQQQQQGLQQTQNDYDIQTQQQQQQQQQQYGYYDNQQSNQSQFQDW